MAIPSRLVVRWRGQIKTAYVDLTPREQASDQAEADKILAIIASETQEKASGARTVLEPSSTKGMSRNQKRKAGLIEVVRKDGGEVYANETKREKKSAIQPLGGGMVAVEEGQLQIVRDLINDIVGTTQKIGAMINQDRMTSAEMVFIAAALKEIVNEFVAPDKQAAFINRLRERIPAIVGRTEVKGE